MTSTYLRTALTSASIAVWMMAAPAFAADWTAQKESAPQPDGISEGIKALLSGEALVISKDGAPELSFWFVKETPLSAKPESAEKALDQVKESQLMGVVEVHADRRDYRDDEMPKGVYTVRMGLRPNDGDHLGSSDYTYFGVLIPVSKDTKVDGFGSHDSLSEASAEETSVYHPSIISFRPDSKPDAELLSVVELPEDHKAVRVALVAKAGDAVETVAFEIVVEGEARH